MSLSKVLEITGVRPVDIKVEYNADLQKTEYTIIFDQPVNKKEIRSKMTKSGFFYFVKVIENEQD